MTVSLQFNPRVIAHRGASCYAPENTMSAFTKAALLGIQWVEFDVMLAACGTAIIFHDETLDRTTNGRGKVGDFTYSYLRTLDAGSWFDPAFSGERIPTLAQLAQFLAASGLRANVEIKPLPGQEQATVDETLTVLSAYFPENFSSILFSSFSRAALEYLRLRAPCCHIGLLQHHWESDWQQAALSLNCVSVNVNQEILLPEKAAEIKALGKLLLSYTVNDIERARELYGWGVDAVFSDYPDRVC